MPFVSDQDYAEREYHKITLAKKRLENKAGPDSRLVPLHPTVETVRYVSYLQDQKLPTKGQLAFERVKSSGSLLNYALYTFTDIYFKNHDPNELCDLWTKFNQLFKLSPRVNEHHRFTVWKTNLLKTKFELLRKALQCLDETIRVQYVRYVNSILALGFVAYRNKTISPALTTPSSPEDLFDKAAADDAIRAAESQRMVQMCGGVNNNNFTECLSSTAAYARVIGNIQHIQCTMKDKIIPIDDVLVAVDTCTGELWCEPLNNVAAVDKSSSGVYNNDHNDTDDYNILVFNEPGHQNPSRGYVIDSICAKIDPQVTETLNFYDMYKRATLYAAQPYRAILAKEPSNNSDAKNKRNDDDESIFKMAASSSSSSWCYDSSVDDVYDSATVTCGATNDKMVTRFLLDLRKNNLTEDKDVDKVIRKLTSGQYASRDYIDDGGSCAVNKRGNSSNNILELMDPLDGQSIVEKSKQVFSAALLRNSSSATVKPAEEFKKKLEFEKNLVDHLVKQVKQTTSKNQTYVKCIRNLAILSSKTTAQKRKLEDKHTMMELELVDTKKRLEIIQAKMASQNITTSTVAATNAKKKKSDIAKVKKDSFLKAFLDGSRHSSDDDDDDDDVINTKSEKKSSSLAATVAGLAAKQQQRRERRQSKSNDILCCPEGYKVAASTVTPHPPDYLTLRKILDDYWLSILRDYWGYEPEFNPTGEKIDEKPSSNTEDVLYKPFLNLMGLTTYFTITNSAPFFSSSPSAATITSTTPPTNSTTTVRPPPLAILDERDLFNKVFEQSLCGQTLKLVEENIMASNTTNNNTTNNDAM